jgi:hypothetical protein
MEASFAARIRAIYLQLEPLETPLDTSKTHMVSPSASRPGSPLDLGLGQREVPHREPLPGLLEVEQHRAAAVAVAGSPKKDSDQPALRSIARMFILSSSRKGDVVRGRVS